MAELNKMPKAQSALEYLMIIALVLGIIVPVTYLFFQYSSESNAKIVDSQIIKIGRNIIDTAEIVYFSGEGAKIVVELNMPEGVDDIYILSNRELVFEFTTEIGETESVFFSSVDIPITSVPTTSGGCPTIEGVVRCDLSSIAGLGLKKVEIKSIDDGSGGTEVLIREFAG
jgi:hypothetical protein